MWHRGIRAPDGAARRAAGLRDALRLMGHRGPDDEGLAFFEPASGQTWNFVTSPSARGRVGGDFIQPSRMSSSSGSANSTTR